MVREWESAEFGKGSGGVILLETGIGDDHYRFIATDFIPSWQNKKGWKFDQFNPRLTLSGPIVKGKIWFFDGLDGEYDHVIRPELPAGEDQNTIWRLGNLAKVQANVSPDDIVTASFLVNRLHDNHYRFSLVAPATTTPADSENVYVGSIKEQHSFSSDKLLEFGAAFDQFGFKLVPFGGAPYVLTPEGAQGN